MGKDNSMGYFDYFAITMLGMRFSVWELPGVSLKWTSLPEDNFLHIGYDPK